MSGSYWPFIFLWLGIAAVAGTIGGIVSLRFGAPFYFGGAFAFVLLCMTGLFVLADRIAKRPR